MRAMVLRPAAGQVDLGTIRTPLLPAQGGDLVEPAAGEQQQFQHSAELRPYLRAVSRPPEGLYFIVAEDTVAGLRCLWPMHPGAGIRLHPAVLHQPPKHAGEASEHRPGPCLGRAITAPLQAGRATLARFNDQLMDVMAVDLSQRLVGPACGKATGDYLEALRRRLQAEQPCLFLPAAHTLA